MPNATLVLAAPWASARRDRSRARRGLLRGSNSVCLNGQPHPARSRGDPRARNPHHERRQLLRPVGGDRRRRPGRRCRPRRHSRYRRRIGRRRARESARRTQCHRRRVGPQPAALAARRRAARSLRASAAGRDASRLGSPAPALERDHREATGEWRCGEGHRRSRGRRRRRAAARPLARYEERFARAIAHVINILDPDVIVLGGGMSNIDRLYASVPKLWGAWVVLRSRRIRASCRNVARRLERRARARRGCGGCRATEIDRLLHRRVSRSRI